MSLDNRITPKVPPCFGCHSDLDKYRKTAPWPCHIETSRNEKACIGCTRQSVADETVK
jgi:hypothetical protein